MAFLVQGISGATIRLDAPEIVAGTNAAVESHSLTSVTNEQGRADFPQVPVTAHVVNLHIWAQGYLPYDCALRLEQPGEEPHEWDIIFGPLIAPLGRLRQTKAHVDRLSAWAVLGEQTSRSGATAEGQDS